jgi:hypothetical protein
MRPERALITEPGGSPFNISANLRWNSPELRRSNGHSPENLRNFRMEFPIFLLGTSCWEDTHQMNCLG